MAAAAETVHWISLAKAQRLAAVGRTALRDLIASGRLSVRRLPNSRPKVRLDEIERLVEASTRPANRETEAATC
jgi:hypothetical protein